MRVSTDSLESYCPRGISGRQIVKIRETTGGGKKKKDCTERKREVEGGEKKMGSRGEFIG